ncbi:MAG: HD domain-containing protein [Thermodesulfobacteriota bacterium]
MIEIALSQYGSLTLNPAAPAPDSISRSKLRLITLIHDTCKFKVDINKPKTGNNHHAVIARYFAEKYIDDTSILDIIELHDEAYLSWRKGHYTGNWQRAD